MRDFRKILFCGHDDAKARMWEISENLHRADLTVLERAEHVAEWIKLAQVAPVSVGGRGKEGGLRAATRDLGIDRKEAQRAVKLAGEGFGQVAQNSKRGTRR